MAYTLSSLAPAKWGTTVLPVADWSFSPGISQQSVTHSGNQYATITVKNRIEQRFTMRIPFAIAYATFGNVVSTNSTFEVYSTTFAGGIVGGSGVHGKWSASASCTAMAVITGYSVAQGGIMYADVEVVLLSNNGTANPVTFVSNATLPTLSAQPALHSMGPVKVNGSTVSGASSWSISTGKSFNIPSNDGDLYPTSAAVIDGTPTISVSHSDPIGVLTSLGIDGKTDDCVVYARGYSSNVLASSGAVSVTVGTAELVPSAASVSQGALASSGFTAYPISSDGSTYPLTIDTNATIS